MVETRSNKKQFRMTDHAVIQLQTLKDYYSQKLGKKVSEADVIHLLLEEKVHAAASIPNHSEGVH